MQRVNTKVIFFKVDIINSVIHRSKLKTNGVKGRKSVNVPLVALSSKCSMTKGIGFVSVTLLSGVLESSRKDAKRGEKIERTIVVDLKIDKGFMNQKDLTTTSFFKSAKGE